MDAWAMAAHATAAPWALPLCPRLVHRLDKGRSLPRMIPQTRVPSVNFFLFPVLTRASDTSGVLVMAKGRFAITHYRANVHVFFCLCAVFDTQGQRRS